LRNWVKKLADDPQDAFPGHGPAMPETYHQCCHHSGRLKLDALPDWDWYDISAHLRCTKCGTVGYVDTRLDWSEVIDFNKGIG
jgi:hypothetical protein